mgnify:CR=1 FL=1
MTTSNHDRDGLAKMEPDVPPQLRRLMAEAMGLDDSYIRIMEGPPDPQPKEQGDAEVRSG